MGKSSDLETALKSSKPSVQHYVRELKKENAKLHEKIAKLEVKTMSQNNRIAALKKDAKQRPTFEEMMDLVAKEPASGGS